jgi:hypothetical protein
MLRIHLLGGLTLTWDETLLPSISNVAARSLLAYLAIYSDRYHTRPIPLYYPWLPDRLYPPCWSVPTAWCWWDVNRNWPSYCTRSSPRSGAMVV